MEKNDISKRMFKFFVVISVLLYITQFDKKNFVLASKSLCIAARQTYTLQFWPTRNFRGKILRLPFIGFTLNLIIY